MTIVVLGAKGMLGSDVCKVLSAAGKDFKPLDINDVDITKQKQLNRALSAIKPGVIINCAAYTNVDQAEDERELAFEINHIGAKNLAEYASKSDIILCHISTDYVFDGGKKTPYTEQDKTAPLCVYGASKLAGETEVRKTKKYYLVRTAWLYGKNGKNFVTTIINAAKKPGGLRVVNDQFGNPTYTADLATRIIEIIDNNLPFGIYHATNRGVTTWFDFAREALKITGIKTDVIPIPSEEYPTKVTRPKYSVLSNEKSVAAGLGEMPTWQDALKRFLENL